jgi:hypothetical protein
MSIIINLLPTPFSHCNPSLPLGGTVETSYSSANKPPSPQRQVRHGNYTFALHQSMLRTSMMRFSSVLLLSVWGIKAPAVAGFCPRQSSDTRATLSREGTWLKAAGEQDETLIRADTTSTSRRSLVMLSAASLFSSLVASSSQPVSASDVRGPMELLRPATRVKLYIDHAIDLCQAAPKGTLLASSLEPLADFFAHEPSTFMTAEEANLSRRYQEIDTTSAWQAARRKEREERGKEYGIDYTTPYDQLKILPFWSLGTNKSFRY